MLAEFEVQTPILSASTKDKLNLKATLRQDVETNIAIYPHHVTPYSLTLILAYLHYYTPKRLPNGRFLAVKHVRKLADWIGKPAPKLRSMRQHKWLAVHFTLLQAAGFLTTVGEHIIPQPHITRWLHLPYPANIAHLQRAVGKPGCWQQAAISLGLQNSLGADMMAYLQQMLLQQSLHHQHQMPPLEQSQPVILNGKSSQMWELQLLQQLPLWLQFDLRQLGEWSPSTPLICTPTSIATAVQRGYGRDVIQWILETATQSPLSAQLQTQLMQWSRRANAYRLRTVQLLSTKQHQQMQAVFGRKILRDEIIEQLSPRHAIVTTNMAAKLEKRLLKQNYPLSHFPYPHKGKDKGGDKSVSMQWLSMRVLRGLGELIPLSTPSPHSHLQQIGSQLNDLEKSELEAVAAHILQSLQEAIRGRDAFFPSQKSVPPEWVQIIRRTIDNEKSLEIMYQPLGDIKSSHRRIQPLRLEERGALFYIVAYCYRAEMNLTFRLDRVEKIVRVVA